MSDNKIAELENELAQIKERNQRVEADKAWETSSVRIGAICLTTYLVAAVLLLLIGGKRPLIDAMVPTMGFFLSSRTLPALKNWWIKRRFGQTFNKP